MHNHTTFTIQPTQLVKAALYITFYAQKKQKEKVEKLVNYLSLGLIQFDMGDPNLRGWYHEDETKTLRYFPAINTNDTLIIQFTLKDKRAVTTAWPEMHGKLKHLLNHPDLEKTESLGFRGDKMLKELTWGHTLIYQACLKEENGIDLNQVSLQDLVPSLRSLSPSQHRSLKPLARTKISESYLWLMDIPTKGFDAGMDIPTKGKGFDTGMVYLALSPSKKEAKEMRKNVLVGPTASWLMPDLIAHKSYYQTRRYKFGNRHTNYKGQLKGMRNAAKQILEGMNANALGLTAETQIQGLPKKYGGVIGENLPNLNDYRVSLEREWHNYQRWIQKTDDGNVLRQVDSDEILAFHEAHIQTAMFDLQVLADEGQNAVEAVRAAVEALRTETELKREKQQQRLNFILTVAGLGLGTAQIIDKEAAKAILQLNNVQKTLDWLGITVTPTDRIDQLIAQFVITIIVVGIVLILWFAIKKIRSNSGSPSTNTQ